MKFFGSICGCKNKKKYSMYSAGIVMIHFSIDILMNDCSVIYYKTSM